MHSSASSSIQMLVPDHGLPVGLDQPSCLKAMSRSRSPFRLAVLAVLMVASGCGDNTAQEVDATAAGLGERPESQADAPVATDQSAITTTTRLGDRFEWCATARAAWDTYDEARTAAGTYDLTDELDHAEAVADADALVRQIVASYFVVVGESDLFAGTRRSGEPWMYEGPATVAIERALDAAQQAAAPETLAVWSDAEDAIAAERDDPSFDRSVVSSLALRGAATATVFDVPAYIAYKESFESSCE